ncbi:MAG: 50S ribosome-binding GTPase [Pseudomonadota bacterium]|nr:50S ribosome-binding GTPase [Pseudomonadota bacterium]
MQGGFKFIDELTIDVISGAGGDGIVSFKRTRTRQLPDGGSGGSGGDVYLVGTTAYHGLGHLKNRRWHANRGGTGQTGNKTGESASPLDVPIPIGTRVCERHSGNLLLHIDAPQRYLLVAGGKAGIGNGSIARLTNSTKGSEGTKLELLLDFRLRADVALIGIANSGKSTLLNRISNASTKIAPYPFTTQTPQLGSCDMSEHYQPPLTIVEIPSHNFSNYLKHLLHCQVIVYVVTSEQDIQLLYDTLRAYEPSLVHKHTLIATTDINDNRITLAGRSLPVIDIGADIGILTRKLFQLCQSKAT